MPAPIKLSSSDQKLYDSLLEVRKSTTCTFSKETPFLAKNLVGPDGSLTPLKLRYYQVQGAFHLLKLKRMILGDATGLGKTAESIAAMAYILDTEPSTRFIVVAPKSALYQWASEIRRFSVGIEPVVVETPLAAKGKARIQARAAAYRRWLEALNSGKHAVLILNYATLVRDWNHGAFQPALPNGKPDLKKPVIPGLLDRVTQAAAKRQLAVVFDEVQAFKNMRTKTWETCRYLADRSDRVYGLSATVIKNRLDEAYAIFKCIRPNLFGTKTAFLEDYCHTQLQTVAGGRKVPIVVGYKNLDHFRMRIDPFYLGRLKHEVSDELPVLTTREVRVMLNSAEESKYKDALSGILELGDGDVRDYEEHKALVALTYCQQAVNSLTLLKFKEGDEVGFDQFDLEAGDYKTHKVGSLSSKEEALIELLTEELDDQNVILYTRFESWVGRLQAVLAKHKIESVRITGKESDARVRRAAQEAFQDPKNPVRVCIITNAGSEAINLQSAIAEIFLDNPYSWGDYVQIIGRMIRIGSPHRGVLVYHLVAERPLKKDSRTIDDHILGLLQKKKGLVDKVLGEAAVGALEFDPDDTSAVKALVKSLSGKREKKGSSK